MHLGFVVLAISIASASIVGHTYHIDVLPSGFYVDESSIAYNAYLIAQTGHDEHGVAWPLYFKAFGEYKNPLYIYLLALAFKCFGYSELTTRLLSAFCWALGCGFTYLLGRRLFPEPAPRLYLLLCLGFTPWLFSLSRVSFELIALFPVLALFLLATYRAYEEQSARWALAAGVAIGISIYAYSTFRLLAPLHAMAVFACFPQRRYWRLHLFFAAGAVLAALPYFVYALDNFQNLTQRFSGLTYLNRDDMTVWEKVWAFCRRYLGYFNPKFLAAYGDPQRRHHTGYGGELLLPTVAMLGVGVLTLFTNGEVRKSGFARLLLAGMFLAPLAATLTIETHHSLRSFSMMIFVVLLSTYGVRYVARWRLAGAILVLTAANAGLYAFNYFRDYPPIAAVAFENHGFREALLLSRTLSTGKIVISRSGNQPYIDMLFFDSVLPDPQRKILVVLGEYSDLKEGDVFIFPVPANEALQYREGLVEGSRYGVREFGR